MRPQTVTFAGAWDRLLPEDSDFDEIQTLVESELRITDPDSEAGSGGRGMWWTTTGYREPGVNVLHIEYNQTHDAAEVVAVEIKP